MKKLVSILLTLALAVSFVLAVPVAANDESSSTMVFEDYGNFKLTYDSVTGTYSGMIPMIVDGGFDIYAKEGATTYFSEDPDVTISNHDAFLPNPQGTQTHLIGTSTA